MRTDGRGFPYEVVGGRIYFSNRISTTIRETLAGESVLQNGGRGLCEAGLLISLSAFPSHTAPNSAQHSCIIYRMACEQSRHLLRVTHSFCGNYEPI